jgi:DNA-binding CsgD family transcriptional regulator
MRAIDFDTLSQLLTCHTSEQFAERIESYAKQLGFSSWIYALDVAGPSEPAKQCLMGNYSAGWVDHYFRSSYLGVDPTIQHCREHVAPFFWPQRRRVTGTPAPVTRLFDEAGEFGLVSGVSIPIHGLGCSWGLLSLASPFETSGTDLEALAPDIALLACYAHEAGRLLYPNGPTFPCPPLTGREVECLQWGAEGKSSWEIGRVLGVAERTVVFHMQNAARKLGVTTRQPAIARAVALGLIKP